VLIRAHQQEGRPEVAPHVGQCVRSTSRTGTLEGTSFTLEVTVPNTTAEVSLPDGSASVEVGSGRHAFERTVVPVAPVERPTMPDFSLPED
jgi:hypothetical protein